MKKEIYENNLKALNEKYPVWRERLTNLKRRKKQVQVIAESSFSGETIFKVEKDDRVLYLNGKYEPSQVVEKWLDDQGKMQEYTPIVVVGISNGHHIRRIIEEMPLTSNIIVYEPSIEVFLAALEEVDLEFLFKKDIPLALIVEGINEHEIISYLNMMISIDNLTALKLYISGNYQNLFAEKTEKFVKVLKKHISDLDVTWNTLLRYTSVNAQNIFNNLHHLYEGYSIESLMNMLPNDVPSIIVSAGPSLNKNINDLKKAVGKACIIATDTAMKPLLNAGIIPNFFVVIDGLKPGILFQHKDISKVPMVTMTAVSVESMDAHKGKKFFYQSGSRYEHHLLEECNAKAGKDITLPFLVTGGSVANSAYSLAGYLGSKVIILVGQDLAMTGNRTHADGTFKDKMDLIDINSGEYFEVESIDGGKVLTRGDFDLYRKWFEDMIEKSPSITTVDATEGGALIHGSKIMTLKKAIQKYCKRDFNVKWHVDRRKKLLENDEVKKVALKEFEDSAKKLREVEKKAAEGITNYEKLEKLSHKAVIPDKELQKLFKKIKKVNNYMDSDYMAAVVTDNLVGVDYALRTSVYQTKDDKNSEIQDVAIQGITMLTAVKIAAEEISGLAEKTIVDYAKMHPVERK